MIVLRPFCLARLTLPGFGRCTKCRMSADWCGSHHLSGSTSTPSKASSLISDSISVCSPPWARANGKLWEKTTFIGRHHAGNGGRRGDEADGPASGGRGGSVYLVVRRQSGRLFWLLRAEPGICAISRFAGADPDHFRPGQRPVSGFPASVPYLAFGTEDVNPAMRKDSHYPMLRFRRDALSGFDAQARRSFSGAAIAPSTRT